jgi:ATP-binding cassette, subfamily B, bacterial MsbA
VRDYLRVLSLLRRHPARLGALVVCVIVASSLSSAGITFLSPLVRILFVEDPTPVEQVVEEDAPVQGVGDVPLPARVQELRSQVGRTLEGWLYRGSRTEMLTRLWTTLLAVYVLRNLFAFLQEALRAQLEQRTIHALREALHHKIQRLPLAVFTRERTGYLMSRIIVDVDMMRASIVGVLVEFMSNGLMVMIALTLALLVNWQLLLVTLLIVPPNLALMGWISKRLRRGSHRVQEEMGEASSTLQEMISGIRIVKAFDVDHLERGRFDRVNHRYTRAYEKLKVLAAMSSPVSEVLGIVIAVVIISFGGRLVIEGQLRADLLVLFLGVILWIIGPIKSILKANANLQQSLAAARRIFDVLDTVDEHDRFPATRDRVPPPSEGLRFEGVEFAYATGAEVLRGIDLDVRAGQVVALVGPSGAGKSTMVDLVPRFYDPTRGRLTLDGVDLREFDLGALRRQIGVVSQETILFHDTVARNIAFGAGDVPRERIEEAARTANAHAFVQVLPNGYDTVIGERGLQLSGGQRQRLAIARAVLKNPPILILDEATSALDTESERAVQEAMERLMIGRTTLVIAHRLSTVVRADRIVVMQEGRIVESGTHHELLALDGAYRRLYDLQFREEDARGDDPPRGAAELAG